MYTIFLEYKVVESELSTYKQQIEKISRHLQEHPEVVHYEHYVAVDQDLLYVETVVIRELDMYQKWREQLLAQDQAFPWATIAPFLQGGWAKLHIWAFKKERQHGETGCDFY